MAQFRSPPKHKSKLLHVVIDQIRIGFFAMEPQSEGTGCIYLTYTLSKAQYALGAGREGCLGARLAIIHEPAILSNSIVFIFYFNLRPLET